MIQALMLPGLIINERKLKVRPAEHILQIILATNNGRKLGWSDTADSSFLAC